VEAVYIQWMGVLWRRQVVLSCKLVNKCFKKKFRLLFGQTTYIRGFRILIWKPRLLTDVFCVSSTHCSHIQCQTPENGPWLVRFKSFPI
jgi:hypothetical protein